MKIEKLPSGSYRIRKMYKGTTYTVVTEYKPTQKEAMQLMAEELDKIKTENCSLTFEKAAEKYILAKENILSPSTIRSYLAILKFLSDRFKSLRISEIAQEDVQIEINKYCIGRSPKTTRNAHGFISAVLSLYRPNLILNTTLPQPEAKDDGYIPTASDIKKVLDIAKGTRYEIPFRLGTYGLRRSEVCALTLDDIKGNCIKINKALVQDSSNKWVIKSTKTVKSSREIFIDDALVELIHRCGTIYDGYPDKLIENLHSIQKKAGIPRFRFHDLRHFFVTELSQAGFSEEDIMYLGGYSTPHIMKKVYRHARIDKDLEARKLASKKISDILS